MERHCADAPAGGLVDLLLALQAPIVGIAGGPGVLLAGRDLFVIQIQFRAIAPYDLHGFLSTKDKGPGYSFSRSRRWKTEARANFRAFCGAASRGSHSIDSLAPRITLPAHLAKKAASSSGDSCSMVETTSCPSQFHARVKPPFIHRSILEKAFSKGNFAYLPNR